MNSFEKLCKEIVGLKGRTLITFHSLGDLEAVASALVLEKAVQNSDARMLDSLNAQAKKVLRELGLEVKPVKNFSAYQNLILVDVSNTDLLGERKDEIQGFTGKLIVIDHHYHSNELKATFSYIDRKRTSCCEIIYELLGEMKVELNSRDALLLCCGIFSDTAGFKSANSFTFQAMGDLLEKSGREYGEVLELVRIAPEISERIAGLKAVQKARIERAGEFLACISECGAFELYCASKLVELGCDFAFVGNKKEGKLSGVKNESVRIGSVGRLMEAAGKIMGGSGGGHENVGGAKGKKEKVEKALDACVKMVEEEIGKEEKNAVKIKRY